MEYEFIELGSGDVAFHAYGKDLNEMFANAAKALTAAMFEGPIEPKEERSFELEEPELEMLLKSFLSEVLYIFQTDHLIFSDFNVETDGKKVKATIRGEKYDPKKHQFIIDVKAITYHEMKIEKDEKGWKCTVLVDV